MERWVIDIARRAIGEARLNEAEAVTLDEGVVEVRLTRFAMTANNVTYAALGAPSSLFDNGKGYWDFFSPLDGAGRLPVWGFAQVTSSQVEGLSEGEGLFGYFPLASHARLRPAQIGDQGFDDASPHRADMPAFYNRYQRVAAMHGYEEEKRDWWLVFRPLYLTGWLIADQLEEEADREAEQIVVASASSKTAVSLAHATRTRQDRPRLVGLTSPRGRAFLEPLRLYDELVVYDEVTSLPLARSVYVDVAGNRAVTAAVHEHLGDELALNLVVGRSHWDAGQGDRPWASAKFFAPGRVGKRMKDWGPQAFFERSGRAWKSFLEDAPAMFQIEGREGPEAALQAYREAVAGALEPRLPVVVAL